MTRKRLEWEIYEACVELYESVGCKVKRMSQTRASRQTPGIPDLKIFAPRVSSAWWHEVKTPIGRQSLEQRGFQADAEACGECVLVGGLDEAKAQLLRVGLARMDATLGLVLTPQGSREGASM